MADTDDCLFQSSVEHQNKPHILVLSKYHLSWECSSRTRSCDSNLSEPLVPQNACLDLREVIGVKPIKIPPKPSTLSLRKSYKVNGAPVCFEMQPIGPVGFSVYVLTRVGGHKWRHRQISFQCKDITLCQQWISSIKAALTLPVFNRPRHLVVFVNPFSGKKKAVKIYKEKVLPLFELADIKVQLIETERQNHARDLVQDTLDLSDIDGLICVGGDGMYSEILNGLLNRTSKDRPVDQKDNFDPVPPNIRVGIIPAGSTNTIVYTTIGVSDPVTSALHIIIGDSLGIDVNSVNVNDQFIRYSVTLLGYGYMGDLLKDSENNRWMGPKRYDWSGTKKFLANNYYYGEIKFRLSSNSDSHPADEVKCYSGCETCCQGIEETGSYDTPAFSAGGVDTGSEGSDSDSSWQTVIGKFVAVNSVNMSCSCDLSPAGMSPYCHLGDGCMDLILVSDCSRIEFLKFLLRTAKGDERHTLNFIQMYRVKEFSFRTLDEDADLENLTNSQELPHAQKVKLKRQTSKTSVWNCDGEVIHHPKISVRVHRQLIKLFARGVEDPNTTQYEDQTCQPQCCSPGFDNL